MKKMPEVIGGFTQVEYLSIFLTIIFGIIASEFFAGWGGLLRNRKITRIYWLHLLWTIFIFITFIQNWFGSWPRIRYININFLYFFYSLIPLLIFHFMTITLFPKIRQGRMLNMARFYIDNSRSFFSLFAFYLSITILSTFIYDDWGQVFVQNIIRAGGMTFAILCAVFHRKRWLHWAFLTVCTGGLVQFLLAIPT